MNQKDAHEIKIDMKNVRSVSSIHYLCEYTNIYIMC